MRSSLLIAAALVGPARAWWCTGHMLVATVAKHSGLMTSTTLYKVEALIDTLSADYPQSPDFISSACWADDLRSSGAAQEANWHFLNLPIIEQPFSGVAPQPYPEDNSAWAIEQAEATVYSTTAAQLDQARQLRFLVHIVGDIHQPLHSAEMFSNTFPTGDIGGNLFNITGIDWVSDLHGFWDGGAGLWYEDLTRPLNSTGTAWLTSMASKIIGEFPTTSVTKYLAEYNTTQWAAEANAVAASTAYTATLNGRISDTYTSTAQDAIRQQIAIGGYRLAKTLEYYFSAYEGSFAQYMAETAEGAAPAPVGKAAAGKGALPLLPADYTPSAASLQAAAKHLQRKGKGKVAAKKAALRGAEA